MAHTSLIIDDDVGFILFTPCAVLVVSFGRIMQGTAQDITSAVLLEISGTIYGVLLAHALIRGRSPIESKRVFFRKIWLIITSQYFRGRDSNKVRPDAHQWLRNSRASALNPFQKIKRTQVDFCANAMMILTMTKGVSVLSIASFILINSPISFDSFTNA